MACPLLSLEEFVALACCAVAASGRLAAAAIPAPPIKNRRREREGGAGGAVAGSSSVAGFLVAPLDDSALASCSLRRVLLVKLRRAALCLLLIGRASRDARRRVAPERPAAVCR